MHVQRSGAVESLGASMRRRRHDLAVGSATARPLPALPGAPRAAKKSADDVFANMPNDFLPEKTKGVKLTVKFHLTGMGGGDWFVTIDDGKLTVSKGSGPKPDVTMSTDADDYVKLSNGDMNGPIAFLRGKIRVDGDKGLLQKFEGYFKPVD